MADEEARAIREEVIRALAAQAEAGESGGEGAAEVGVGADVSLAASVPAVGAAQGDAAADDEQMLLAALFDAVRAESAAGRLVEPSSWEAAGLVPAGWTADDWEMNVYEYLEAHAVEPADAPAEPAQKPRTATKPVGIPRFMREEPSEEEVPESIVSDDVLVSENPRRDALESVPTETAAAAASSAAVEASAVGGNPAVADNPTFALPCADIVAMVGAHSYYLYSREHMTNAYARWAFLAKEDDRVATFVECVRQESRTYPRPFEAASLYNEPFCYTSEDVEALWQTVSESGAYPDLATTTASNGDVYYYSTDYLKPAYAASLAEWNSVERSLYL
ncbi:MULTISPECIES: hypothetical protein [Gordonibacter]|uniref:Uncharacterized protein n=1 Tax=Gordonibacter faecis TaxID=3047475 RepID=A0ABT7DT31_9ACTN|nr:MULTISPECIES: hypothetical protein [unclassified Gordonibacter]MDJ1651320.1 hypothetical protein [Gordonibacter sp. KGMB12511]